MDQETLRTLILGIPAIIAAITAAITARRVTGVKHDVAAVKEEVVTGNALTLGKLAADDETRRIELVEPGERTAQEQDHLDSSPMRPPQ